MSAPTVRVWEVLHRVSVDLENAPRITTPFSKSRRPAALLLEYSLRRDVARVDITVQWRNGYREHFPAEGEMPAWVRRIVEANRPADVDHPLEDRHTGTGGWPLPAPTVPNKDTPGVHDPAALHDVVVRGLRALGFTAEDAQRYAGVHQQDALDVAAEAVEDEAWPHEKPETVNRELYRLADKVRAVRPPRAEAQP